MNTCVECARGENSLQMDNNPVRMIWLEHFRIGEEIGFDFCFFLFQTLIYTFYYLYIGQYFFFSRTKKVDVLIESKRKLFTNT